MYVRDMYPNVHFRCIDAAQKWWLAQLGTLGRLVKRDETGHLYTLGPDEQKLEIYETDVLACIPKDQYNTLVGCLP